MGVYCIGWLGVGPISLSESTSDMMKNSSIMKQSDSVSELKSEP